VSRGGNGKYQQAHSSAQQRQGQGNGGRKLLYTAEGHRPVQELDQSREVSDGIEGSHPLDRRQANRRAFFLFLLTSIYLPNRDRISQLIERLVE